MLIRQAVADDLPTIVALLAADQLGSSREQTDGPLDDAYRRAFAAIDADPNQLLVVGDLDDDVVATLQLTFIPYLTFRGSWRAQVEGVRVAESRRGEGLGRELMTWAVEQARERDCHVIQLTSNAARPGAHEFYASLGFEASHVGFKRYLRGDVTTASSRLRRHDRDA